MALMCLVSGSSSATETTRTFALTLKSNKNNVAVNKTFSLVFIKIGNTQIIDL
jgi:hypothetical protein